MQKYANHAGKNYKNKPKITYLLIAANFFLLFSLYYCVFLLLFLSILQSDAIFVLITGQRQIKRDKKTISRDKKRYRGTKNDITGHIVFMSPCYGLISEMNITGRLPEAGNLKLIIAKNMRGHLMSIYKSRSKTVKNGPKHF